MIDREGIRDAHIVEGGEDARIKLAHALQKLTKRGAEGEGSLEIVLAQVAKMGEMTVQEFTYDFDSSVEELVQEIVDAAEEDAAAHHGRVKYAVRVKNPSLRTIFTLHRPLIEDDDDDFEDLDELPNRRGLIQQQMRHTEVFAKEMISSSKTDRSFMYNMIKDLQQENQQLKKQWFEGQSIIENLRNMQFARDLEIEKLRKAEQRKDQVAGMLLQTGPMIAAKLLGGGAGAAAQTSTEMLGQRTPLESMVEGFLASIEQNPEKLQKLAQILDPVDLANLQGIHKYMAERREKEEEMRQAHAQAQQPSTQTNGTNGQPPYPGYTPYTGVSP